MDGAPDEVDDWGFHMVTHYTSFTEVHATEHAPVLSLNFNTLLMSVTVQSQGGVFVQRTCGVHFRTDYYILVSILVTARLVLFNLASLHDLVTVRALRHGSFQKGPSENADFAIDSATTLLGTLVSGVFVRALQTDSSLATLQSVELA